MAKGIGSTFWMARRNTTCGPIAAANVGIPIRVQVDETTVFEFEEPTGKGEWKLYGSKPFAAADLRDYVDVHGPNQF